MMIVLSCSYLPDEEGTLYEPKTETGDYAIYYSGSIQPENAFIMIPGGLVDPYAYACWIRDLVREDSSFAVVLMKYPSNLAIANIGKVKKIMDELAGFTHWAVGGHSLGGVVAATTLDDNRELFDGLVLMASWSREAADLSDWEGTVLSIYASEDSLATEEEVQENSNFLPAGVQIDSPDMIPDGDRRTYYYRIAGGNHSGFGCYGLQDGDGTPWITSEAQQELMITVMKSYFESLW